jgi:hypothetical protein
VQFVFGPLWYQNDEWSRLRFAWRGPQFTGYQDVETLAASVRSGRNGYSARGDERAVPRAGGEQRGDHALHHPRQHDDARPCIGGPGCATRRPRGGLSGRHRRGLTAGAGSWSAAELTFHRANATATGVCSHGAVARAAVLTGTTFPKTKPGPPEG